MGHDTHFLSRLQRLGDHRQVDLALGLYRDPRAVRLILARVGLPEDTERVAIALDHSPQPPHLIVAGNGAFVTCLGPGMRAHAPHVVTRAEVDAALEMSVTLGRADDRIAWRGGLDALIARVVNAGQRLAREDFEAAYVMAPLMQGLIDDLMNEAASTIERIQLSVTAHRLRRPNRATSDAVRQYGLLSALIDHGVLLSIPFSEVLVAVGEAHAVRGVSSALIATADLSTATRVACYAGHLGPAVIEPYVESWRSSTMIHEALHPLAALIGIAARHPEARGPALAALDETPRLSHRAETAGAVLGHLVETTRRSLDDVEAAEAHVRSQMRTMLEADDTPDAIVDALLAASTGPLLGKVMTILPAMATWAGRREPTDFYLPAAQVDLLTGRIAADAARARLLAFVQFYGRDRPVKRGPKIGRNDPCPCGSGAKYKQCCRPR